MISREAGWSLDKEDNNEVGEHTIEAKGWPCFLWQLNKGSLKTLKFRASILQLLEETGTTHRGMERMGVAILVPYSCIRDLVYFVRHFSYRDSSIVNQDL